MTLISKNLFATAAFISAALFSHLLLAQGSLKVEEETVVNASASTVWKMIGDYNHLDVWHPVVVDSAVDKSNNNPGDVRTLTLADGASIVEKLLAYSNSDKSYTYAITQSPLPISDYVSNISVTDIKDGKSVIKWSSTFNTTEVDDAKGIEIISGIYLAGLSNLEKHFNK